MGKTKRSIQFVDWCPTGFKVGINYQLLYQEETPPRLLVLSACSPTPQLLLRPGLGWTTSLTSCMPRGPSFTGMLGRVWRRESSLKLVRTLLLLRRIMRRLALTLLKLKMAKEM